MSDYAEYDSLVSQKSQAEGQARACEKRVEDYDNKIERLKRAAHQLPGMKSSFKSIRKAEKALSETGNDWMGETKNKFAQKIDTLETQNDRYYKNTLDYVHDELNNEITRLQNLRAEEWGILGRLYGVINDLGTKIANFFN